MKKSLTVQEFKSCRVEKTPQLSNSKTFKLILFFFTFLAFPPSISLLNPPQSPFMVRQAHHPEQSGGTKGGDRGISYLPNFFSQALDFSDLDVRDSQNRPVQTTEAKNSLHQLFSFSVVHLLVNETLPIAASVREILQKLFAPLSEGFSRAKKWLITKFCWAIALAVKRFSDLFAATRLPFTVFMGDSNLRGVSRPHYLLSAICYLQLSLPLLC